MKSYKIIELANKISKKHKIIGTRHGEKLKEFLITEEEREFAREADSMWIIETNKNSKNVKNP